MAYVKLDTGILTSSLWVDRGSRDIFITALLMAIPRQFKDPSACYNVRDLNPSGFIVPPGDYGFVAAAGPGIVRMALVDQEEGMKALEVLAAPDPESRTPDFDGRRMVRVDGGFIVLNYDKYRWKDHTAADRMHRYRERVRETPVTRNLNDATRNVTEAEAEAEVKALKKEEIRASRFILSSLPPEWESYCKAKRPDLDPDDVFDSFKDFWTAKAGQGARKLDWSATWRLWVRNEKENRNGPKQDIPALIAELEARGK